VKVIRYREIGSTQSFLKRQVNSSFGVLIFSGQEDFLIFYYLKVRLDVINLIAEK